MASPFGGKIEPSPLSGSSMVGINAHDTNKSPLEVERTGIALGKKRKPQPEPEELKINFEYSFLQYCQILRFIHHRSIHLPFKLLYISDYGKKLGGFAVRGCARTPFGNRP